MSQFPQQLSVAVQDGDFENSNAITRNLSQFLQQLSVAVQDELQPNEVSDGVAAGSCKGDYAVLQCCSEVIHGAAGGGICQHKRAKRICKECLGSSICEHERIKYLCKE